MSHSTTPQIALNAGATSCERAPETQLHELQALNDEIVDLFYTQTFSPDKLCTAHDVCVTFFNLLLRHWDLCCIVIYLRDANGRLTESAIHTIEQLDEAKARDIGALLVDLIKRKEGEAQIWLDDTNAKNFGEKESGVGVQTDDDADEAACVRAMREAGVRAGIGIPIYARGALVGALVSITGYPERLRPALHGLRFTAAPIVIAVGNARRAAELREQHRRIAQLNAELQRRGDALEQANRELQRVDRYRSLFLARMSHELRTPLTSILGFSEILLDQEPLTEAQRRFCEKIQASGQQLQTSLNQLVDLSRLEAGHTELFLHEFSLREALRESCAAVSRLAQKQHVELKCQPSPDLTPIVSDEGKLRQVLYNFFAHAIGRSREGEQVIVHAENTSDAPTRFHLSIEDKGAPLTDAAHLFDPVDLDAPTEDATSMNELGLVIARRLIDALGGSVSLESPAEGGLKVLIELPVAPTEAT